MLSAVGHLIMTAAPANLSRTAQGFRNWSRSAVMCSLILGVLVVLAALPSDGVGFSVCPFQALTGYDCPGCGLTRSISSALQWEFAKSFHHHPLGIPLILAGLTLIASYVRLRMKHKFGGMLVVSPLREWVIVRNRFMPTVVFVFLLVWLIRLG
jgi:Protein of unknown function (DUF2752)